MDAEFDIHDHRHQLKQLKDSGDTAAFENRDELTCPTCSKSFDRLMIIESRGVRFPENDGRPFCLLRRANDMVLFRH
ncbi:DUF7385 family protein [Halopiger goleimassiliensis]